jgi:hypothetical protein
MLKYTGDILFWKVTTTFRQGVGVQTALITWCGQVVANYFTEYKYFFLDVISNKESLVDDGQAWSLYMMVYTHTQRTIQVPYTT